MMDSKIVALQDRMVLLEAQDVKRGKELCSLLRKHLEQQETLDQLEGKNQKLHGQLNSYKTTSSATIAGLRSQLTAAIIKIKADTLETLIKLLNPHHLSLQCHEDLREEVKNVSKELKVIKEDNLKVLEEAKQVKKEQAIIRAELKALREDLSVKKYFSKEESCPDENQQACKIPEKSLPSCVPNASTSQAMKLTTKKKEGSGSTTFSISKPNPNPKTTENCSGFTIGLSKPDLITQSKESCDGFAQGLSKSDKNFSKLKDSISLFCCDLSKSVNGTNARPKDDSGEISTDSSKTDWKSEETCTPSSFDLSKPVVKTVSRKSSGSFPFNLSNSDANAKALDCIGKFTIGVSNSDTTANKKQPKSYIIHNLPLKSKVETKPIDKPYQFMFSKAKPDAKIVIDVNSFNFSFGPSKFDSKTESKNGFEGFAVGLSKSNTNDNISEGSSSLSCFDLSNSNVSIKSKDSSGGISINLSKTDGNGKSKETSRPFSLELSKPCANTNSKESSSEFSFDHSNPDPNTNSKGNSGEILTDLLKPNAAAKSKPHGVTLLSQHKSALNTKSVKTSGEILSNQAVSHLHTTLEETSDELLLSLSKPLFRKKIHQVWFLANQSLLWNRAWAWNSTSDAALETSVSPKISTLKHKPDVILGAWKLSESNQSKGTVHVVADTSECAVNHLKDISDNSLDTIEYPIPINNQSK